jgi:putative membrane protein insertion efficiency factor
MDSGHAWQPKTAGAFSLRAGVRGASASRPTKPIVLDASVCQPSWPSRVHARDAARRRCVNAGAHGLCLPPSKPIGRQAESRRRRDQESGKGSGQESRQAALQSDPRRIAFAFERPLVRRPVPDRLRDDAISRVAETLDRCGGPGRPAAKEGAMIAAKFLVGAIRIYQRIVSPCLPAGTCRFHPTCSEYAAQAIDRYGALRGVALSAKRLCRCGPWHAGGPDPVP